MHSKQSFCGANQCSPTPIRANTHDLASPLPTRRNRTQLAHPRQHRPIRRHRHETFSKDSKRVYKTNRILPDADPVEWDTAKAASYAAEEATRHAENSAKMSELLKTLWQNEQTD